MSRVALSAWADLGTGESKSGLSTGNGSFGLGVQWTRGIASLDADYRIVGNRGRNDVNYGTTSMTLPNEVTLNGGLNIPVGWWHATSYWPPE